MERPGEIKGAVRGLNRTEPPIVDSESGSGAINSNQHIGAGGHGQQNITRGGNHTFNSGEYIITGNSPRVYIGSRETYLGGLFTSGQINPVIDKRSIERRKGGLLAGSYQWVLSNDDFKRWRNEEDVKLLWIRGDPGKGKTMLLCGIIDELGKEIQGDAGKNLAYFFCLDERRDDFVAVLRGLLMSLFARQPDLRQAYEERLRGQLPLNVDSWDALAHLARDVLQDDELGDTYIVIDALDECHQGRWDLLHLISRTRSPRVKFLVASRSSDRIKEALEIGTAAGSHLLSLELNSESISAAVHFYIEHLVLEYDAAIRDAAEQYLKSNAGSTFLWVALVTQELAKDRFPSWKSKSSILDRLKAFPANLEKLYQRILDGMLGDPDENEEVDVETRRTLCPRILAIVLTVQRPVSLSELSSLIEWPPDFPNDDSTRAEAVGYCRSFLTVGQEDDRGKIYLVHQSAKDFLLKNAVDTLFPSGLESHHWNVAVCSVQAMSKVLHKGMRNPRTRQKRSTNTPSKADTATRGALELAGYSCAHWIRHLELGAEKEPGLGHLEALRDDGWLHHFLRQHLLYWFEAIGLLKVAGRSITAMARLISLVWAAHPEINAAPQDASQTRTPAWWHWRTRLSRFASMPEDPPAMTEHSEVLRLAIDAFKSLRYYGAIIEDNPLQVYTSMLIFSPSCSLVRQTYLEDQKIGWVSLSRPAARDWSACIHTLEGADDTGTAVFSPDGSRVATVLRASGEIKIWDTIMGRCQITLKADLQSNAALVFSPNGNTVAAILRDGSATIWDSATGETRHRFDLGPDVPMSASFLPDGNCVILARLGFVTSFSIFNTVSGQRMSRTTFGRKPRDNSAQMLVDSVLVPSKNKIVMATSEPSLVLYDLEKGLCGTEVPCDGPRCRVGQPAKQLDLQAEYLSVSPDRNHVSYVHPEKACVVTLLDIRTRQHWSMHIDHAPGISGLGMALAVGGRLLSWGQEWAPSANDHERHIEVWDIRGNRHARKLKGHAMSVVCVCAHPSEAFAASGSADMTVRLWNLDTGQCNAVYRGHHSKIRSVAYSPDGINLASMQWGGNVKLWDLHAQGGSSDDPSQGFALRSVSHLEFSPNSEHVVTCSLLQEEAAPLKGRLSTDIWDVASGTSRQVKSAECDLLDFDFDSLSTGSRPAPRIIFSPSGGYIAHSLQKDYAVYVESVRTGRPNSTLQISGNKAQQSSSHLRYPHIQFSADEKILMMQETRGDILKGAHPSFQTFNAPPDRREGEISAFSRDLRFAARAYEDWPLRNCVEVQDTVSGARWSFETDRGAPVRSVAFSESDGLLACASYDKVQVWDVQKQQRSMTLPRHNSSAISSIAFSVPFRLDANILLVASDDSVVTMWNVKEKEKRKRTPLQISSRYMAEHFVDGKLKTCVDISQMWKALVSRQPRPKLDPFFGIARKFSHTCITRNNKEVLWLPSEYRPDQWAVQDSNMFIFCYGGQILILRFSKDENAYPEELRSSLLLAKKTVTGDGLQRALLRGAR